MLRELIGRSWRAVRSIFARPTPETHLVYGSQPGKLWDVRAERWVDEAESYRPAPAGRSGVDFSLYGPVYRAVGGQA